jgi:DNA-binding Xre family transcriptional regulator
MISYSPFRQWFVTYHPTQKRMDFQKECGLSSRTAARIWNDRPVNTETIDKICNAYNLRVEQVMVHIRPNIEKPGTE